MDSGGNSTPSVDPQCPAIQSEIRFPQLSCAGDAIRSEKPPALIGRGFQFALSVASSFRVKAPRNSRLSGHRVDVTGEQRELSGEGGSRDKSKLIPLPTPRPPPLPAGRALVRRASGDMAGSPRAARPPARPYGDSSVSEDARRARSGAPGQRSDQQSAKESAGALSTLPHAARSAAPFGPALDHLPPALGRRRSLPRSVPVIDRRADIKNRKNRFARRAG